MSNEPESDGPDPSAARTLELSGAAGPAPRDPEAGPDLSVGEDADFERLLLFLKESRAFDFTGYKRPSLIRRVRHRMHELSIPDVDEYLDLLQLQADEFTNLFNTILINVTRFFRDAEAWGYLRDHILPKLLADHDDSPVRVWSAGCAAGQEAYSIAMLLQEMMGGGVPGPRQDLCHGHRRGRAGLRAPGVLHREGVAGPDRGVPGALFRTGRFPLATCRRTFDAA